MVLITLSSLSPFSEEEVDYRSGALEKCLRKLFSRKEVFRKPWNGVALPKCEFMEGKMFMKRSFAGGK
jgi:hypothetical protein